MGIKDFFKIVHEGVPITDLGTPIDLENLKGKNICIDASWVIYSSLTALQHVDTLTDEKGNPTGHINNVMQRILSYKTKEINQLWIFDNPESNPVKAIAYESRNTRREKSTNEKVKFKMTSKHVNQIKKVLDFAGVSYIEAPPGIEAEQYGACLCRGENPVCYAMLSGDSDVLIFGGKFIRQFKEKKPGRKTKVTSYHLYDPDIIIGEYSLTTNELVEIAIALGSDFAAKVPGVGPKTVVKRALASTIKFNEEQLRAIEYITSVVPICMDDLHESEINKKALSEYLMKHGFEETRVNTLVEKLAD